MTNKKKVNLSCYPRFFFWRGLFETFFWTIFAILFVALGKNYLGTDILGKIYGSVVGEEKNFNQYFLGGDSVAEKSKILNYAIFFIIAIIILNLISFQVNSYLWKKDRYIENNRFHLHNKWIFTINTFIDIAYACLLTTSFVSAFTLILALLLVTFNSWEVFTWQKSLKNPQIEDFFSWKDQYVCKILFYSTIIIFIVPLFISSLQTFHNNALEGSPEGFAKAYQTLITSNITLKNIMELVMQGNYNLFHWFVLLWFVKNIISDRQEEFTNFWTEINAMEKKIASFKHHYYYQESWAIANNAQINLGDYNYLENNPNFMIRGYLGGDLDIEDFAKKNRKVIKYIEFCESRIKKPSKRNFLNWCLFNEFNSWEDCLRTENLVSEWAGRRSA